MTTTSSEMIRVLAFQEEGMWVAQCINYDISAQGPDFDTAMHRLRVTVKAECGYTLNKHGAPFAGLSPAPAEFAEKFHALNQTLQSDDMEFRIAA